MATVGENIRAAREALGISQQRLCELAGCSLRYESGLEQNEYKNPGAYILRRLAEALDVTPTQLLRGLDEREPRKEKV